MKKRHFGRIYLVTDGTEITISIKQARYALEQETQMPFQFTNVVLIFQRFKKLQPLFIHGSVVVMILSATVLSGQMTDYTGQNASRLMEAPGEASSNSSTSAYVAANVADGLGESLASRVTVDAENLTNQQQLMAADDTYLSNVSTISTNSVSREDVVKYTVQSGDSVKSIAQDFNINTRTVRWANDLIDSEEVSPGDELTILPVNGVLYKVKSGDSADKLAERYQANAAQIISFNNAEIDGLKKGQKVVIPDGVLPESEQPQRDITPNNSYFASTFTPQHGGNGYSYGYCTWYVANRIDVPSNWGNATTWDNYAAASGWTVSNTPTPGAIAQNSYMAGGLGHVAIVEKVSSDGTEIFMSDMNGFAGWGAEGSGWAPTSKYTYITK